MLPKLFSVAASGDSMFLFLDENAAPCTMACTFCPTSLRPDRPDAPRNTELMRRATAELDELLVAHRPTQVDLASDDILNFVGLMDLLAVTARHGVSTRLLTPGLRVADPSFARKLAASGVRVVLTVLSQDPTVYAAITQRDAAHAQVFQALKTAREVGLPVDLGIVVVDRNQDELPALLRLVRDLGSDPIAVRLFHPDVHVAPDAYFAQYPDFGRVLATLRALAASGEPWPHLELSNLPWCAWDPTGLESLDLTLIGSANRVQHHTLDTCATCPAAPRCAGVHPAYFASHPTWNPDPARAQAALDWQSGRDLARQQDQAVPEPTEAVWWSAVAAPGITLGVEKVREGAGYFFRTDELGVFYRDESSDAEVKAAFLTALRAAVRDLRAAGAPGGEWIRGRLERLVEEVRGAGSTAPR